jgi:hypothetical protein
MFHIINEILDPMGLLLLLGMTKLRNVSLSEIWDEGGLGTDLI